jgi:hypothetical protein
MLLFSKREISRNSFTSRGEEKKELISLNCRLRLHQTLKDYVKDGLFINYLLLQQKEEDIILLNFKNLRELSLRELGYDITSIFNNNYNLDINDQKFEDKYFLDLIEITIIFCNQNRRDLYIEHIKNILEEEKEEYTIHSYILVRKSHGLNSIIPFLKDKILKDKILALTYRTRTYDRTPINSDYYEYLARVSADVIQYIFSASNKRDTAESAEKLCLEIAEKYTTNDKVDTLKDLLNETAKNTKTLNNQISNIRHTDKYTISLESNHLYKMIYLKNFALLEMVLMSFPEKYISEKSAQEAQNEYIIKYSIDIKKIYFINSINKSKNKIDTDTFTNEDIDLEEIPF